MLLMSLGLHGLVLFTPVAPSEEDLVPPPDPEEDGIGITRIDPPRSRAGTAQGATGTVETAASAPAIAVAAGANQANSGNRRSQAAETRDRRQSRSSNRRQARRRDPNQSRNANRRQPPTTGPNDIAELPSTGAIRVPETPAPIKAPSEKELFAEYVKVFQSYRVLEEPLGEALWLADLAEIDRANAGLTVTAIDNLGKIPYESKVCLPEPPAAAQVLVLVGADGTVDPYIQLEQSTGYLEFNSAAEVLVNDFSFPDQNSAQAYRVDIPVDYNANDCQQPGTVVNLPQSYFALLNSYDPAAQTNERQAEAATKAWLTDLTESTGVAAAPSPSTASGQLTSASANAESFTLPGLSSFKSQVEYAFDVCLPIEPKAAWWGATVNADGTLQGDLQPLRSTGYRALDEQAKALVEAADFPASEMTLAYVIEVPVDYNGLLCQPLDADELFEPGAIQIPASPAPQNAPADSPGTITQATENSNAPVSAAQSAQLAAVGRQNALADPAGKLNVENPELAATSVNSDWPEDIDKTCFLAATAPPNQLVPVAGAETAFFFSQNADLTIESIADLYGLSATELGTHCDAPLYGLTENGTQQLAVAVVGIGPGNASSLVVVWPTDPRQDIPPVSPGASPDPQPSTENPRGLGMISGRHQ